jgi:aspartyl-tRNA synthetase
MSFVEQEDIIKLVEHHLITMTKKLFPHKKIVSEPFERMSRHDAMNIYGSDKPELRTKEIQLIDLTQR